MKRKWRIVHGFNQGSGPALELKVNISEDWTTINWRWHGDGIVTKDEMVELARHWDRVKGFSAVASHIREHISRATEHDQSSD